MGELKRYFDKNGCELHEGDVVLWDDGRMDVLYRTTEDELGTDATNPAWLKTERAVPGEYGIYPLTDADTKCLTKYNMEVTSNVQ